MNRRHRSAQIAGRDSVQLHTLIFFSGEGAKEETAYILDVDTTESKPPSLTVMVPRYGIEGKVKVDVSAEDPYLQRFPEKHMIQYKTSNIEWSYQVFDKIEVRLWVRELQDHQRELVVELTKPPEVVSSGDETRKRQQSSNMESQKSKKPKRP